MEKDLKQPTVNLSTSKGRRILDRLSGFDTSIGPNNTLTGTLSGPGHCIVLGRVEGNSALSGTLVIGEGGMWVGNIEAQNVLVAGQVHGDIFAHGKIEVVSTASIIGTMRCPVIAIAEGAVYKGGIHMAEVKHFADKRNKE